MMQTENKKQSEWNDWSSFTNYSVGIITEDATI